MTKLFCQVVIYGNFCCCGRAQKTTIGESAGGFDIENVLTHNSSYVANLFFATTFPNLIGENSFDIPLFLRSDILLL
jgi:hypothetical protein